MWGVVGAMGNVIWCYRSDENTFTFRMWKGGNAVVFLSVFARAVLDLLIANVGVHTWFVRCLSSFCDGFSARSKLSGCFASGGGEFG